MPDFGGGYESDRESGGNGFGSSGRGGPGDTKDGASEKNTSFAYDRRSGKVVQVGAPSLGGGMMTTGIGGQMALRNNLRSYGGTSALGMSTRIGSNTSPFHNSYWDNRRRNIREEAAARSKAYDNAYSSIFNDQNVSWSDKFRDLQALNAGKVGDLEKRGYDMTGVKATHRGDEEDVETMREVAAASDYIQYNPMTGAYEMTPEWGYAPLGLMGGILPGRFAQLAYEQTGSPYAAMGTGLVSGKLASNYAPSSPGYTKGVLGAMGALGMSVPGPLSQLGQALGLASGARDLNYVGITNDRGPNEVRQDYSDGMMQSTTIDNSRFQAPEDNATPSMADLMAENWQRLWNQSHGGLIG